MQHVSILTGCTLPAHPGPPRETAADAEPKQETRRDQSVQLPWGALGRHPGDFSPQ